MKFNNSQYLELLTVVVDFGKGSKILHYAKEHGIQGGTIFLGLGTVQNRLLELLGLNETRKEIVIMASDSKTISNLMPALDAKFHFKKQNHGICFSNEITGLHGHYFKDAQPAQQRSENKDMYNAIYVIVDRGSAEDVIESATAAGARGGTIIGGRGSGIHETSTVFSMNIEPEKEIVFLLVASDITDAIAQRIRIDMNIDEPGSGILVIQPVKDAYGIF